MPLLEADMKRIITSLLEPTWAQWRILGIPFEKDSVSIAYKTFETTKTNASNRKWIHVLGIYQNK
jgi:hypothetical protein